MRTHLFVPILSALVASHVDAQSELKDYQNYDFVPGEKILFEDDLADSPDGEFPPHWDLLSGQAVVTTIDGQRTLVITDGNYGKVCPAMKISSYLGSAFTVEFDYLVPNGGYPIIVFFKDADGNEERNIQFAQRGEVTTQAFDHDLNAGFKGDQDAFGDRWHHAAMAFRDGQIKCYVDQYRVLVVPKCGFSPASLIFGGIAELKFRNVRVAEGGGMNMLGKILTDGRLTTHAITFDVNKSTIKPESMGFLNELAKWMKENAAVKLEIDGHTDSDGDDAANMKLSQARADAVKKVLTDLGADGGRLTAKGFGESKPVASNTSFDGKAANRRVELVKM